MRRHAHTHSHTSSPVCFTGGFILCGHIKVKGQAVTLLGIFSHIRTLLIVFVCVCETDRMNIYVAKTSAQWTHCVWECVRDRVMTVVFVEACRVGESYCWCFPQVSFYCLEYNEQREVCVCVSLLFLPVLALSQRQTEGSAFTWSEVQKNQSRSIEVSVNVD